MLKLIGIDKSGDSSWGSGEPVFVEPEHVIGIEGKQHRWHSFRPEQTYATVYLTTGISIDVLMDAERVQRMVDEAKASGGAGGGA